MSQASLAYNLGAWPLIRFCSHSINRKKGDDTMKHLRFTSLVAIILACPMVAVAQLGWTSIPSPTTNDLYAVFFADSLVGTAVGASGTIIRTLDGGLHWITQTSGTAQTLRGITQLNTDTSIAVGDSAVILRTTNGGATWATVFGGQNIVLNDIKMIDRDTGLAVGAPSIYRTTDGGVTWISQNTPFAANFTGAAFEDRDSGLVVTDIGKVIKTTDGGKSWRTILPNSNYGLFNVVSIKGNTYAAAGGVQNTGVLVLTTDGGANWASIASIYLRYFLDVCFSDSINGIAVGDAGIILQTTDGGNAWLSYTTDTLHALFGIAISQPGRGISVGTRGTILEITYTSITDVDQKNEEKRPLSFSLSQNYPNPFNTTTIIHYTVPSTQPVSIVIYNILGQRVATLLHEVKQAGKYSVSWDASNMSSGIYLYKLGAGSFVAFKTMVLLK